MFRLSNVGIIQTAEADGNNTPFLSFRHSLDRYAQPLKQDI